MKTIAATLLISLALLIQACQKSDELADGKPAIKSIAFAGVPAQNVQFDASNSRITVQLPAILQGGLQPIFTLTDGARVIDGVMADNTIDLTPFCSCTSSAQSRTVTLRIANQKGTAVYELTLVTAGSLKAQSTNIPLTFSRKTKRLELSLPVENLYSNPHIDMLLFTNLATGAVARISADAACLNSCTSTAPNQLVFVIGSPIEHDLLPGTYSIAAGGINFPQQLLVTE